MPRDIPVNTRLYSKVKDDAKKKFKRWPSLYGSAWLSKEYTRRGGKWRSNNSKSKKISKRPTRKSPTQATSGVNRWFREQWIQVIPYLTKGQKIACGSKKDAAKACRPLKRITDKTPITIPELIKLHGKEKLATMARKKIKDMDGRLYWKSGTFKSST